MADSSGWHITVDSLQICLEVAMRQKGLLMASLTVMQTYLSLEVSHFLDFLEKKTTHSSQKAIQFFIWVLKSTEQHS